MSRSDTFVEQMDDYMVQAADSDSVDETIFYGNKGLMMGLTAIVVELRLLREAIEELRQ